MKNYPKAKEVHDLMLISQITKSLADKELAEKYLDLAMFYIEESAQRGHFQTAIYIPVRVKARVIPLLHELGFEVSPPPSCYSRFIVKWEME